jgi:hypothetical protein
MFAKFARAFAKNDSVKATKFVQEHAIMTSRQLDMIRDHINLNNNCSIIFLIGLASGIGFMMQREHEHNDKRFEQVDKRLDKIEIGINDLKDIILKKV